MPWLSHHRWLVCVFVTLSVLDLLLTWRLVEAPHSRVYEANPLAAAVLLRFGWLGLGVFKTVCVASGLGAIVLVNRWRPALGLRLLGLLCPALLGVVGYSAALLAAGPSDRVTQKILEREAQRGVVLDRELQLGQDYGDLCRQLGYELAAGNVDLQAALRTLNAYLTRTGYNPCRQLHPFCRGLNDQECLAALLVRQAGFAREEHPEMAPCLPLLAKQFRTLCHCPLPEFASESHEAPAKEPEAA
jgi:hypothetical protein